MSREQQTITWRVVTIGLLSLCAIIFGYGIEKFDRKFEKQEAMMFIMKDDIGSIRMDVALLKQEQEHMKEQE